MDGPSRTSLSVAAHRALESERDRPLFVDPWARALAGAAGFATAAELAVTSSLPDPGDVPSMFAVRTRFYDDAVLAAARHGGATQVVILGAGMDTRAFRLDWPAGTLLIEVDRAATFDHKEPILAAAGARARCRRRTVASDLADNWTDGAATAGLDPGAPTVWVAEGLLYYLDEREVAALLDAMSSSSAAGSTLVGDVAPTVLRDLASLQPWRDLLGRLGEPFRSFCDDGAALLGRHGWTTTTATSIAEVSSAAGEPLPAVGSLAARRLLVAVR